MTPAPRVDGRCDARFEGVRHAFVENFETRGELGAALCISVDGHVVVDLWGGHTDAAHRRRWTPETLVNVFSVGKGLVALVVARLVGLGIVTVETPVASIWPEFASGGKDHISILHLLTHQAGLPAIRRRLPPGAMLDWRVMTDALAAEEPWWEPGTAHGYHTNTFGFLVGEVLRRLTGRSVGDLLRDVTGPLDADIHLGVPAAEDPRIADFLWPDDPPPEAEPAGLTPTERMRYNSYFNPSGLSGAGVVNSRSWRAAEIPSTNTHATARGVARVYTVLAAGGAAHGVDVVDPGALRRATEEQVYGHDEVLDRSSRFGLGFQLTQSERPLGPNDAAYGHFGAGGSLGFCDPDAGVALGYVMNQLGPRWQNERNRALVDAVYDALG